MVVVVVDYGVEGGGMECACVCVCALLGWGMLCFNPVFSATTDTILPYIPYMCQIN